MRPSLALKTACLLAAALFLAPGCSGIKNEFQDRNLYRIGPISISGQRVVSGQVPRILVKRFDIAPEFESNAFVFLISQDQFREDFYNQFMVAPARMITHSVKEAFLASGLFRPVPAKGFADAEYRLKGKVTALYGDIRDKNGYSGVMELRLFLEKQTGHGFDGVINQNYHAQVPLEHPSAKGLSAAWNRCLEQILSDFLMDFEAL